MKKTTLILSFLIAAVSVITLGSISELNAQSTGTITGTVVDAETGETIIGANVVIEGTTTGASTDIDGKYTIRDIEEGTYSFVFSYISYQKQTVTGVEISAGETTNLDIALSSETEELDDIIVSASAILDNEVGLLRQRQKSISFNDAISAEMISQTGSSNAADAMVKVTGASVVEGKYVYIRGLGDRYSSTHLNGSELPSADPNRKSFQLDLFPSSFLENLVTVKTFTPDRPGNFSGGIVDVSTVDFPENTTLEFSTSTTYNTQSSFNTTLLDQKGSSDWYARGSSSRTVPDIFNNIDPVEVPSQQTARTNQEQAELLDRMANAFNPEMAPRDRDVPINQSYSVAYGSVEQLFGRDLGIMGSITYGRDYSSANNGVNGSYSLIGNVESTDSLTSSLLLDDRTGQSETNLGGMASLSYKLHQNHRFSAKYLQTQSGISEGRFLEGFWTELGSATYQSRVASYTERGLQSLQLKADHYFPEFLNITAELRGSFSANYQDEPDLKYFTNRVTFVPQVDQLVYSDLGGNNPPPTRYFRFLNENNMNLNVDFEIPLAFAKMPTGKIKIGGSYLDITREFRQRRFDYERGNGFRLVEYTLENGPDFNGYFSQTGIIGTASNGNYQFGNLITEAVSEKSNYDGLQSTRAAYGMLELYLTERLRFIGGARIEDTSIEMISFDEDQPKGELKNVDILPSVNLIYSLSDNMNLRAAYTNTVARPTFRELAPYSTFSFRGDFVFQGNSSLTRTLIKNYDLRWEWYPRPGEIFAVSGFYKDFDDPLERVIRSDIGNKTASIQNVDQAIVYGVEVEGRKRLNNISNLFRYIELGANFSYVHSEVDIPERELVLIRESDPNPSTKRQLQGQSPYLINANVSYNNPGPLGVVATLSYNTFGDRLLSVAEGATPNLFERSYSTVNFVVNKTIGQHFAINLAAKNLTNPEIKVSQQYKGAEYINESYQRGRSISLGLKYSF
ncbi:TonB-dependent receptor [Rhodohalobacter sp. 8-1]|uniref:TonB-dependent receptor n=1 Tax=Rhodohalobacter sp. 8-1 TaxID=3131972 RepID=UPI0030EF300C